MSRVLATACLVAAVLACGAPPASASCAADSGPAGSDIIFLGTAHETEGGYTAMTVEEVWAGRHLPRTVRVRTGQTEPNVSSSVDADLTPGESYVVGASDELSASTCSIAEAGDRSEPSAPPASEEIMALRPTVPFVPAGEGNLADDDQSGSGVGQVLVVFLPLVALGLIALVIARRERRTRPA